MLTFKEILFIQVLALYSKVSMKHISAHDKFFKEVRVQSKAQGRFHCPALKIGKLPKQTPSSAKTPCIIVFGVSEAC